MPLAAWVVVSGGEQARVPRRRWQEVSSEDTLLLVSPGCFSCTPQALGSDLRWALFKTRVDQALLGPGLDAGLASAPRGAPVWGCACVGGAKGLAAPQTFNLQVTL